jgi:hypothetical protein
VTRIHHSDSPHKDESGQQRDAAASFANFLVARKKDLQRIARATRGECELADVQNEAWLLAQELPQSKGWVVDFSNHEQQEKFLSYIYQQLVRYTELVVRNAVRLDHNPNGDASDEPHPLFGMLAAADSDDPLAALLRAEAEKLHEAEPDVHHSLASAYLWLLRRLDYDMRSVANHLLISLSYCYQRFAHARKLAHAQLVLPPTLSDPNGRFMPKPWRKERVFRVPEQLMFDFDEGLALLP